MSRAIRKQLFEILNSLQEASGFLQELSKNGKKKDMISMLNDCQNCAIAIGNKIESVYGNAKSSIHQLEEYCELLYQMSESLDEPDQLEKMYAPCHRQLARIREEMENELPDKLEILFLPYKASMWDSLESVWHAAASDSACDAIVMPIPYYEKNADGTFGKLHYEGNQYPANVNITDWQTYSLEERRPDVIYIHNPYDNCNHVTSVYPKYYSENLKKYTDRLVYIPYFVLEEIRPDDSEKIKAMEHFCLLPGVFHANKVIVQSENMRQIYIDVLMKTACRQNLQLDRKQLGKKILGLGSPKMDQHSEVEKEQISLPEEWLSILKKPDGCLKKIVLYNTGVTGLLEQDIKMIDKLEAVFSFFKEKTDVVALWWRPHPLIESAIASMRPELLKKYQEIKENYRAEGWGIYDDTSELHRAIDISDAYYGDSSSIVQMYEKTGKPVMILDVNSDVYG